MLHAACTASVKQHIRHLLPASRMTRGPHNRTQEESDLPLEGDPHARRGAGCIAALASLHPGAMALRNLRQQAAGPHDGSPLLEGVQPQQRGGQLQGKAPRPSLSHVHGSIAQVQEVLVVGVASVPM